MLKAGWGTQPLRIPPFLCLSALMSLMSPRPDKSGNYTGAVGKRTYRGESIYLFLDFTILEINSRFNIAKNSVPVISHYPIRKLIGSLRSSFYRVNEYNGYSQ